MTIDCLLHVHSSFSYDSKTDLAEIRRVACAQGIACVLMSEHNNFMDADSMTAFVARCRELSDEQCLIVPGLELAFDSNAVHLLAFGVTRYIDSVAPGTTFQSLVASIREQHGVAVLAHPSHRGAAGRLQPEDLQALDGIEVWNVKDGNRFFPAVDDANLLQRVRKDAPRAIFGFAGLDWHHLNKFVRIVLRVEAPALSREAILGALRAGCFRVHCGSVSLPATGHIAATSAWVYKNMSSALKGTRQVAYRWQSRLERAGVRPPRALLAAARRLFS